MVAKMIDNNLRSEIMGLIHLKQEGGMRIILTCSTTLFAWQTTLKTGMHT